MTTNQPSCDKYTFGDTARAGRRLGLLAAAYDADTRSLLRSVAWERCRVAIDLGCGPGHTTRLLQETVRPERTIGLDNSERFIAQARRQSHLGLEFVVHDVTTEPWPAPPADLMLCRFLLTHLGDPQPTLALWARASSPGARLVVHETASLEAEHPALARYYELVGELQAHYGQRLYIGEELDSAFDGTGWEIVQSGVVVLDKPAAVMAELHHMNLLTWREDPFAISRFDRAELEQVLEALARIVEGSEDAGVVRNGARQVIARRAA